jgi:transcriptional regulator PpsR
VQVAEATKSSEQALPAGAGKQVDELFAKLPDALVVLDPAGKISFVNQSFLDLTELGSEQIARGESLDRWLGRPGVDLGVMLSNLRQHGVIRAFATTMRGELGASTEVEISATQLGQGLSPYLGFSIRNVERRRVGEARIGRSLPRSVEQLTELVGRVSLKELVRETTDVIERLCIEAALELTQDNRASAAEMLGLSRQSLYVKLRRYGLGELESD